MKVHASNSIRISGRAGTVDFLRKLSPGATVAVKVTERLGPQTAILDIQGRRIRAEFLRGVPGNNRLMLKLEDASNSTYTFKIISSTDRQDFLSRLLEYSVLTIKDVLRDNIMDIGSFVQKGPDTIFSLHAYLLDVTDWKRRHDSLMKLFTRFYSLGASVEVLRDLSLMIAGNGTGGALLCYILEIFSGYNKQKRHLLGKEGLEQAIHELETLIEKSGDDDRVFLLQSLWDVFKDANEGSKFIMVPIKDDDEFHICAALAGENSIIFRVELSQLGTVHLLARQEKNMIDVMICVQNEKSLEKFKNSLEDLKDTLYNAGLKVALKVYNSNFIIDKIVEINSYYSLNSVLDIKV